ncbi:MAG: Smr/MutS family protein, partial [Alphaproteobacteria bacterium]|nr:Smr/MutS family protein [Alphaproteobacteria bacterium]
PVARPAPPGPPPVPRLPEIGPGDRAGVDKRTAKRLKRGPLAVEARMDLHGLTQEEAHRALSAFVQGSQAAGRRGVLVITGKGLRPDGTTGVLRAAVPRWLNQPDLRERIVAFTHATPRDGGDGALYLLLKRKR